MSQAAQARESWADPPTRRTRREPVSWASPEELEVLGGLGEDPSADWTVLTLERDQPPAERDGAGRRDVLADVDADWDRAGRVAAAPRAGARPRNAGARTTRTRHAADDVDTASMAVPVASRATDAPPAPRRPSVAGEPGDERRTVVIRGHATPLRMDAGADRRRPAPRTRDRIGHRPDRVAMWAVMLGLLLIVVATMTAG